MRDCDRDLRYHFICQDLYARFKQVICYSARISLYIRLVRIFIEVHRQWLSVTQIGGQDSKRVMCLHSRAVLTLDLRESLDEFDCALVHVL